MNKFEIPCLTEETTISNSKNGLVASLIVLFIITTSYLYYGTIDGFISYDFFYISTVLIFIYSIYIIFLFRGNLIITFRYLILLVPIFITSYVWWQYEGEVHTHYMGHEYQTLKATYMVVYGGMLSAIGAAAGWFFGLYKFRNYTSIDSEKKVFYNYLKLHSKKILYIGLVGALFFGYSYLVVKGGTLFSAGGYGRVESIKLNFNVYNIFQIFFMALALISIRLTYKTYKLSFLILIISFIFGILAGSRADYLLPIIILLIIMMDSNMLQEYYYPKSKIIFKRYIRVALFIFFGFFAAISFAIWRHSIDMNLFTIIIEHLESISKVLFLEMRGHTIFWMETANHAIGGFYAFVQKIELGYIDYFYGSDYLSFIPRALPGVIRPESFNTLDLAWYTEINGQRMTQGGIFESAEAYANFGFLGCFFVSFLISFFFAWLLKKAKSNFSIFFMAWYVVNGFMLPRAIWYQSFVFLRIATVMLFFYIIFYILKQRWLFGLNPMFKKN